MPSDFSGVTKLSKRMGQYAKALGGDGARIIAQAMGVEAQKLADAAGRADLGGDRMFTGGPGRGSGWHRVGPLDTRVRLLDPGEALLTPASKGAAAVWTTVTRGRNNTNAAGFSGPGVNRKTGVTNRNKKTGALRKVKANTSSKKWSGHTAGKGTALQAQTAIDRAMPKIVERELARITLQILGD